MLPHDGKEEDLRLCREAGCDTVVFKPINRHHFVETARKFLHLKCRAAPRVKARLRITYGPDPEDMLLKFTVNVSTGGVFIETSEFHPVDTPLSIIFELPELKDGVRCQARVAWINHHENRMKPLLPPGLGVEFLDLSLEDLEAIFSFVKKEFLTPPGRLG
jgi:uncharacterized protein (TIGR02266 family)